MTSPDIAVALSAPEHGLRHWWHRQILRRYPDDEGTVTLRHRRIYLLPTKRGLAFLFTVTLMLLTSLNYAISLGFVITFLWLGVFAATLTHTFRNLYGMKISAISAGHTFAGGSLAFTVSIDSGDHERERVQLSVEKTPAEKASSKSETSSEETSSQCFDLLSASTRLITLTRPTYRRGRLPMGRLTVATEAPLGLWRAWAYVHFSLEGLVFPAPEVAPPSLPQGVDPQGGTGMGRVGNDDLAGLREYQRGDPLQRVAWKTVARGVGWYTKAFEGGEGRHFVHLDYNQMPSALDTEMRLSRLTAWTLLCEREGKPFALTLPQVVLPLCKGVSHSEEALTLLALFRNDRAEVSAETGGRR
ncbi:MAG: DUF58 domain-containing protein [Burkholderiales bacterium]|jgi:uncharacterized protein (DUF58 family)|nr:DUF58 domain-containing protein [Burkholderiales bacterium]